MQDHYPINKHSWHYRGEKGKVSNVVNYSARRKKCMRKEFMVRSDTDDRVLRHNIHKVKEERRNMDGGMLFILKKNAHLNSLRRLSTSCRSAGFSPTRTKLGSESRHVHSVGAATVAIAGCSFPSSASRMRTDPFRPSVSVASACRRRPITLGVGLRLIVTSCPCPDSLMRSSGTGLGLRTRGGGWHGC